MCLSTIRKVPKVTKWNSREFFSKHWIVKAPVLNYPPSFFRTTLQLLSFQEKDHVYVDNCFWCPESVWETIQQAHVNVDWNTSIYRKVNISEFPRHFDVPFRYNFDGWKIDVVLTYFLWRNFHGRKINVVSTDDVLFLQNFDVKKIDVISMFFGFFYFFSWPNSIHEKSMLFWCTFLVEH